MKVIGPTHLGHRFSLYEEVKGFPCQFNWKADFNKTSIKNLQMCLPKKPGLKCVSGILSIVGSCNTQCHFWPCGVTTDLLVSLLTLWCHYRPCGVTTDLVVSTWRSGAWWPGDSPSPRSVVDTAPSASQTLPRVVGSTCRNTHMIAMVFSLSSLDKTWSHQTLRKQ